MSEESALRTKCFRKKMEDAGQANPFGFNPLQYNQNDGIAVTRDWALQKEESRPSFLINIKALEGVFTEYVPGRNVFVKDGNSLVKQRWPHNSNEIREVSELRRELALKDINSPIKEPQSALVKEFRAKGKGRGRVY